MAWTLEVSLLPGYCPSAFKSNNYLVHDSSHITEKHLLPLKRMGYMDTSGNTDSDECSGTYWVVTDAGKLFFRDNYTRYIKQ